MFRYPHPTSPPTTTFSNKSFSIMADVRALLREERVARRINHPQATYSAMGTLSCLVCHIQIKAESLWEKHLRSPYHNSHLQKTRQETLDKSRPTLSPPAEPSRARSPQQNSKKRKADLDVEERPISTKKAKAVDDVSSNLVDEGVIKQSGEESELGSKEQGNTTADTDIHPQDRTSNEPKPSRIALQNLSMPPPPLPHSVSLSTRPPLPDPAPLASIDEDEWAAFERDVAIPLAPLLSSASALLASAGTITAAPLSAAELVAQAREEAELQQTKVDQAEAEAEKEDAERRLEDEFEEMAGLEERVRVLKEKREALRKGGGGGGGGGGMGKMDQVDIKPIVMMDEADGGRRRETNKTKDDGGKDAVNQESDEGSSDDDDDTDEWGNWRR